MRRYAAACGCPGVAGCVPAPAPGVGACGGAGFAQQGSRA